MLQLESLANELLFDVFELLNTANLIHAFFGLNSRFNHLLYAHFQNHQFSLQSIANHDFDILCRQHLPILTDKIISFHLSNDNETPNLCELFLSRHFTFDRFIDLKTLSLYYINSFYIINQIIIQCRHLSHLKHLNLINCNVNSNSNNTINMMNNIWSLPKLTHCTINTIEIKHIVLYKLSVISESIEFLSIYKISGYITMLDYLFKYTPNLQQLHTNVIHCSIYDQHESIFLSLISLKTSIIGNTFSTIYLLKSLPNLSNLSLTTVGFDMDRNSWQKIFNNHLPNLKVFYLKMDFTFPSTVNIHAQIDQLVDSFRTSFWLETHQWYIRCDCYSSNQCSDAILYTLPYTFKKCSYLKSHYSKSTKPDDEEFSSCNHVSLIEQKNIPINSFNDLKLFNIRFPNIHHFEIILPLTDHFDTFNLSFNRLKSLHVKLNNTFGYSHLQMLLNRACQLYSLEFYSFGESPEGLFQLTSSSIRRLDLLVAQLIHGTFFSHQDCINLINSPLGRQCEVLLMEFENRTDIIHLIENIPSLRILIFRCQDIVLNYLKSSSIIKDFIQWLRQHISSKTLIITDQTGGSKISLWIYQETKQSLSIDNTLTWNRKVLLRLLTSIRRLFSLRTSHN